MLMSIFHGKRFIEWRRWFATVKFPIIVLLCGMVNMADVCSSMFFTDNLKIHTLLSSDILYYYNMKSAFFSVAGYCIANCSGAVLYAEDYEANSVYMRVNRLGMAGYSAGKVLQTIVSSFICGIGTILVCFGALGLFYHIPLFLEINSNEPLGWTENLLLQQGRSKEYLFTLVVLSGFAYVFYSLMSLLLSIVVPKKKVIISFPMILWFFNQYIISKSKFIPGYLKPSIVFDTTYGLSEYLKISPYSAVALTGLGLMIISLLIYGILLFKLRRSGVFGGVEDE